MPDTLEKMIPPLLKDTILLKTTSQNVLSDANETPQDYVLIVDIFRKPQVLASPFKTLSIF